MGGPRLVVMGVSGCGKTTLGRTLAGRTGWPFLDADDLHSAEAIRQMAAGLPLSDDDRWPWLDQVAAWIAARRTAGEAGIVACSALKRPYRDRLRAADPDLRFVYLRADREQIDRRMAGRKGHFFPTVLVANQFANLEEPDPDEDAVIVGFGQPPGDEVETILTALTPTADRSDLRENSES